MSPHSLRTLVSLALGFTFFAAPISHAAGPKREKPLTSEKDKVSYIIGHQIGGTLKRDGFDVDPETVRIGLAEALQGKESRISYEEAHKIMLAYKRTVPAKLENQDKAEAAKNAENGKRFLIENGVQPGVVVTPSGLQYRVIKAGSGTSPKLTDTVKVHYRGTLIDGTEFDSSHKRGAPAEFEVGRVIKGWTEALQLMTPGAKWQLFIPPELAYGASSAGQVIGPQSTLLFDVELLEIKGAAAP